jgi:hypothetical protein
MGDHGQIWRTEAAGGQSVPGDAAAIVLPSGQTVTLVETIWNTSGPEGLVTRFRFLAPEINPETGSVDFTAAADDIAWLCQNFALERVVQTGPLPSQVIVSLADRDLPFGETVPEATQYFEAFRIEDGTCIWEVF